jgi:NAD(P)-dependent dehydrogenase (short-subunit alcohol dehydrogenase family)
MADCDRFRAAGRNHGGVDFLVNNAGRSIRRAIENSYDRFHDFERTMQLNYFGCLRVTMGLLPGMVPSEGPCRQHQLDRRADQRAALLGLRGQQGGAGRLDALRQQRVRRPGRQLHHHQHAAGAHADDRADQDLQQRADAQPRGGRRHGRAGLHHKPVRIATRLGIFGRCCTRWRRAWRRSS